MTEKRFTMYQNTIYDNGNVLSPFNCMKVMNTLHNENEQLKHDATVLIQSNKDYRKENEQLKSALNQRTEQCDVFYKENEQLKLQNKRYMMMVNCNSDLNDEIYEQLKKTEKNYKLALEENEQLKQQLIDVDKLIDDKIKEYQKYDEYDTEKYYIGTQLLKELKKELGGDVE